MSKDSQFIVKLAFLCYVFLELPDVQRTLQKSARLKKTLLKRNKIVKNTTLEFLKKTIFAAETGLDDLKNYLSIMFFLQRIRSLW